MFQNVVEEVENKSGASENILKVKEKVITFESSKIWDDTKIIENIYVKK